VFSGHYDDLLPLWAKNQYITIPTAPDALAKATVNRLTLQPLNASALP
jgi:acyl-homoserine lactone acylase PvdQ